MPCGGGSEGAASDGLGDLELLTVVSRGSGLNRLGGGGEGDMVLGRRYGRMGWRMYQPMLVLSPPFRKGRFASGRIRGTRAWMQGRTRGWADCGENEVFLEVQSGIHGESFLRNYGVRERCDETRCRRVDR